MSVKLADAGTQITNEAAVRLSLVFETGAFTALKAQFIRELLIVYEKEQNLCFYMSEILLDLFKFKLAGLEEVCLLIVPHLEVILVSFSSREETVVRVVVGSKARVDMAEVFDVLGLGINLILHPHDFPS